MRLERHPSDAAERGRGRGHDQKKTTSADDYDWLEAKHQTKKEQPIEIIFNHYQDLMIKQPLLMNVTQSALITTCSVVISQWIAGMEDNDWWEVTVAALVSSLWITPILLVWFNNVAKMSMGTVPKLMLDQGIFSPIFTATIVIWRVLLMGNVPLSELQSLIPRTILTSWTFWIPARAVTMIFVPIHFRMISTTVLSFLWNIILAILLRR